MKHHDKPAYIRIVIANKYYKKADTSEKITVIKEADLQPLFTINACSHYELIQLTGAKTSMCAALQPPGQTSAAPWRNDLICIKSSCPMSSS